MLVHVLLTNTRWGVYTVATGGNPVGAREAGVQIKRIKVGNFMLAAMLAGFTGISEGDPDRRRSSRWPADRN